MNWQYASSRGTCFAPDEEASKQTLIRQFYEDSVLRYGRQSEQALALSKFLDQRKLVELAVTNRRSYPVTQIANS